MKNKKVMKLISFAVILLTIAMAITNIFAAEVPTDFNGDQSGASGVRHAIEVILGIVQVVAGGVAVIMLIVLAVKYISAAPSEKADIKKSATTYVVGAVLLFAASGILGVIKSFSTSIVSGK